MRDVGWGGGGGAGWKRWVPKEEINRDTEMQEEKRELERQKYQGVGF